MTFVFCVAAGEGEEVDGEEYYDEDEGEEDQVLSEYGGGWGC